MRRGVIAFFLLPDSGAASGRIRQNNVSLCGCKGEADLPEANGYVRYQRQILAARGFE
jgi:hypothetical protein